MASYGQHRGNCPDELRERAVRMVLEHGQEYGTQWEAICSVADKLGPQAETVRLWVRGAEIDQGRRPGQRRRHVGDPSACEADRYGRGRGEALGAAVQLAVFGDQRVTLPPDWTKATAVSLLGDVHVDASAGVASGARLTFLGVAGDLVIRVPAGCRVRTDGVVLFGDPVIDLVQGDGPEVSITSFSLFGDVRITDKPI